MTRYRDPEREEVVEVEDLEEKHATDRAILVTDGEEEYWLPWSQIEVEPGDKGLINVKMPRWLAEEKGMV